MTLGDELVERFAWVQGHADVWRLFDDASLLARLVTALADPFREDGVTKVVGVEARGFVLGAAVALELRAGFVAVRKSPGRLPGTKLEVVTEPDYRGTRHRFVLQRRALAAGDRALLVDDWAERGSQALAARALVEACGAHLVGVSLLVDQLEDPVREALGRVEALVPAAALGTSAY
jgi:adenine phosphoribosyltransferase